MILGACGIPLSNTTPLTNEHLAGVAESEPWKVSARIGAGCPVEGKARPARCGVRLPCCLLSIITLLDLCIACFGVSSGQAARAPKQTSACRTSGHAAGKLPALPNKQVHAILRDTLRASCPRSQTNKCMPCFGTHCGQAARAPTANYFKPTANRFKRVVLKMRKQHH